MAVSPEYIGMRKADRPSLRHKIVALAGVGAGLLATWWAGCEYLGDGISKAFLGVLLFWIILIVWLGGKFGRWAAPILGLAFVLQCGGCLLLPIGSNFVRENSVQSDCQARLRGLGIALKSYYADQGSFPPRQVVDAAGKPIHGWRTLLLPYLEERTLFERLNLKEPWDGPHNREASQATLNSYQCSRHPCSERLTTDYLAIAGPNTAWSGKRGTKLEDFADGPENTILIVEVADSDIGWAEPRDLDIVTMFSATSGLRPSSRHRFPHGFSALFADGSIRFLRPDLDEATLRALVSPAGGEKVDPKDCAVVMPRISM